MTARKARNYAREADHFDLVQAAEAPRRLFDSPPSERPDALFVLNDYMAFKALSVLRHELKLRAPGDVT